MLKIGEFTRLSRYNESYLSRMFQEHAGRSFSETVRDFKLRKAAELLKTTNWKLDHICEEIGYRDTRQFIRSLNQRGGRESIRMLLNLFCFNPFNQIPARRLQTVRCSSDRLLKYRSPPSPAGLWASRPTLTDSPTGSVNRRTISNLSPSSE